MALAGGNPFFLEEILAMTGEGGDRVPETVQGVIAARIDLLPPDAKQVLQRASVIGRRFTPPQLAVLAGGPDLGRILRRLAERGLLFTEPGGGRAFKHALIRDVAYDSIPRQERARLHLALACSLEDDPIVSRQTVANHYAAAAGLGADEARSDAVRTAARGRRRRPRRVCARPGAAPGDARPVARGGRPRAMRWRPRRSATPAG